MPKISVIMSCFNAEKTIAAAVQSILDQTERDFEFIIFDDASQDTTCSIIQDFDDDRIRFFPGKTNRGLTFRLNKGLELAAAPIIARMDADDVSEPNRFAVQLGELQAGSCAVAASFSYMIDEKGQRIGVIAPELKEADPLEYLMNNASIYVHSSVMFSREKILSVGGYDSALRTRQDFDLWMKVLEAGYRITIIPQYLHSLRFHRSSISSQGLGNWKLNVVVAARAQLRQNGTVVSVSDMQLVADETPAVKRYARTIRARRAARRILSDRTIGGFLREAVTLIGDLDTLLRPTSLGAARIALVRAAVSLSSGDRA